jgi:hypothetical protein
MALKTIKRTVQIEETIWRFPHVAEQIFEKLDVQSLRKCEHVNKIWQEYIFESKILSIQLLQKYTQIPATILKKKLLKEDVQTVQKLENFARIAFSRIVFAEFKSKRQLLDAMLYYLLVKGPELLTKPCLFVQELDRSIASRIESVTKTRYQLSELLIQNYDKLYINPKEVFCENMILKAISIIITRKDDRMFNLIIENIQNKNPIVSIAISKPWGFGMTALHLAARTGSLNICKLIIETIDDLNPLDIEQRTPLENAIQFGHNDIIDFINNEIQKRKEDFEQIMADKK